MLRSYILKFKCSFFVFILGILNIFTFSFILGCSNSKTNNKDNIADSIARVKKINDSIEKEKHLQDSLADVKRIQDSISRDDSIKKAKQMRINYKQTNKAPKYGVIPVKHL